ncbi:MAG: hypothetical protein ACRDZZ_05000 [Ilumatobacteraceae bacterium]
MSTTVSNKRRATAVGLTAGLLGGGVAGLTLGVPGLTSAAGANPAAVVQQEDPPTDDTSDDTTDATTDTTTDDSDAPAERGDRLRELLQELVDDGTLTSEQADTVTSFLVENRPDGHHRFPGWFERRHDGFGLDRGEIADLFGLEPSELRDLVRDGQSLADVATAHGVDVQTVIDTFVNAAEEHLDRAVTNGRLTQEEADEKLAELTERITEMVNTARPTDAD